MHGTALMPRATIAQLVDRRNKAIALYAEAYETIVAADNAVKKAQAMADSAGPLTGDGRYSFHLRETIEKFTGAVALPDRAFYLSTARRIVDTCVWQHIIKVTDLEMLMDRQAKEELHKSMMEQEKRHRSRREIEEDETPLADPDEFAGGMPEITVENILATLDRFAGEADMIFRRGLANSFSGLDRRFRSHDGFKVGARMILSYAFDDSGHWNYNRDQESTIADIERAFRLLDGHPPSHRYASIRQAIDNDRQGRWGARQSETDSEYFKIRIFKNGNAHIWFKRDDLVEKVNKLLAEYYGEVIGDAKTEGADADPLAEIKNTPARYFGFYPTPDKAADELIDRAPLYRRDGEPKLTVLEPSAGTGALARRALAKGATVDCCEIQPHLAETLSTDLYRKVFNQDFLALDPGVTGLYDVVVMNPPFDRERDIDHVMHAWEFLKPTGCLVAIMSAGTEFRETHKSIAFRAFMEKHKAQQYDLPSGSFSEVGTNVNTIIVKVYKDGRSFYR